MARPMKIRPARMAAMDVAWGDVIVTAPGQSEVIGTVVEAKTSGDYVQITVRTPGGQRREIKPTAPERPVWVHVPTGRA